MRAVLFFFLGVILGACARPVTPGPVRDHANIAPELVSKTVALVGQTSDGQSAAFCSGVWVSASLILTATHCVDEYELGDEVSYVIRDDVYLSGADMRQALVVPRTAKVAMFDPGHDLALLRAVNPPGHLTATPAPGSIAQGQFAQSMGHSLGLWWSYSDGSVAAIRQLEVNGLDLVWLQAAVPISPGNSGGGLFDEHGDLIGIAHASFSSPRAQMLNLFVHRDYIRDFILTFAGNQ